MATLNAPISLAAATSLTAALHGNRQVLFNGPSANLTVQSDAAGGTANDDEFQVVTEDASAGVPTLVLPDASTLVGGKDVIMGAVRKGANLWHKYMIPEGIFGALKRGLVPAADATPDATKYLSQLGWTTAASKVRVLTPLAAFSTVAISITNGTSARIRVPGGVFGPNAFGVVVCVHGKVTAGTVDAPNVQFFAVPVGADYTSSTNTLAGNFLAPASPANGFCQSMSFLFGNRVDGGSIICSQQQNIPTPTSAAITAARRLTVARDVSADWDLIAAITTGANDTAKVFDFVLVVFNPDL